LLNYLPLFESLSDYLSLFEFKLKLKPLSEYLLRFSSKLLSYYLRFKDSIRFIFKPQFDYAGGNYDNAKGNYKNNSISPESRLIVPFIQGTPNDGNGDGPRKPNKLPLNGSGKNTTSSSASSSIKSESISSEGSDSDRSSSPRPKSPYHAKKRVSCGKDGVKQYKELIRRAYFDKRTKLISPALPLGNPANSTNERPFLRNKSDAKLVSCALQ
jgi:hypothetical protein